MIRILVLVFSVGIFWGCISKYHILFAEGYSMCTLLSYTEKEFDACMRDEGCHEGMTEIQCGVARERTMSKDEVKKVLKNPENKEDYRKYKKRWKK